MHIKTKKITLLLIVFVLLSIILSACRQAEPALDVDAQRTAFAQTADVQASLTAAAQPTPTETPLPSPTFTPTEIPTSTPILSPTPSEPVDQPPGNGTDVAIWLANDPPDNTKFAPGEAFTVTWTIENIGSSTWSTSYYVEFATGEQMEAVEKIFLPYPVPPERNVQISIDFVAPESLGAKRSNWKLFNANDNAFYDFYIVIEVVEGEGS
jgi:hypothetical protein